MSRQSFRDLKETIDLKDGEIDELTMELESKKDEINKLKLYSTKLKYEKKNLEDKLDNEINNEKAKMKELDDLDKKIKEKQEIIDDKQDQINYLRTLINDYKEQVKGNSDNLELQLRKIAKTYDDALFRARNIAAPLNAKRLNKNTPCVKAGKCLNCSSPERICRGMFTLWEKPTSYECEIILINENLGY